MLAGIQGKVNCHQGLPLRTEQRGILQLASIWDKLMLVLSYFDEADHLNIILKALHKEANVLEKKLAAVRGAISALLGTKGNRTTAKRTLSKKARLRISAAQKARWAKARKSKNVKKAA
jgi:hypothetical protein